MQRKVFADYFNNKTKINVGSNKHVYFDISGLDENKELRSLIVMNLVDMMFQFIDNNKDRKKRIVIDEAWDSLQNKKIGLSKYIMNMFRYIRKLSGGVWVISQSALDFNTKEMKASIQTNISTLIVMQQTKKQILEDTCEVFGFNEEEKELLNSIELNIQKGYSEAFISQGNFSTILRINESPFNYWMFTTDADDNALFREEVKKYGNLNDSNAVVRAIKSLANP